jgi:hypothetical protein
MHIQQGSRGLICLYLRVKVDMEGIDDEVEIGHTNSFLLAQPSSSAGNSTPFNSARARNAPSGSTNSAKPKPWGLLAGVMRRLNEFICPHA